MASVLGISADHAARLIRSARVTSGSRGGIRGVHEIDLKRALEAAGCAISYRSMRGNPEGLMSAEQWAERHADLFASGHVIIVFGTHYGTLLGDQYQCSLTRSVVPVAEMPQAHHKVEAYFLVTALPAAAPVDAVADERRRNALALAKAQTMARKHGIVIQRIAGGGEYRVFCPELLDDDPHDDRPNPETGLEVLELVEDYVSCLQNGYLEAVTDPCFLNPPQVPAVQGRSTRETCGLAT
jgi:hypothetical protein